MKEFRVSINATFSAGDEEDALVKLSQYFRGLAKKRLDPRPIFETGAIEVKISCKEEKIAGT